MLKNLQSFLSDDAGFEGAEKALLLCIALAVIMAVGKLIQGGATAAASKAASALSGGGGLGD